MATTPPSGRDGKKATESLPMPSRNPLPLSASQEAQVREVFNARVRMQCEPEIKGVWYYYLFLPIALRELFRCFILSYHDFVPAHRPKLQQYLQKKCPRLTITFVCYIAFAECARNRTFTIPFACRKMSHQMNSCMMAHATQAEHDRAREEWFATRMERARERERKERRKIEQEKFHREWWGLPERDPDEVRREEAKLRQGERIGGGYEKRGGGGEGTKR
ncbi:hypothetical protein PG988_002993 [Apiospora saccharicola]